MKLFSSNNPQNKVSFREALVNAFPADKGLYVPESLPVLDPELLQAMPGMTFPEIALAIATPLLSDEFSRQELKEICDQAFNFAVPLHHLAGNDFVLELYRGPTLAFKDFGARFMALALQKVLEKNQVEKKDTRPVLVLTATSGDTGGAVASGFQGVKGVNVLILYPEDRISEQQRRQLSTPGKNVHTVAVKGSFDDCQRLVKEAFLDPALSSRYQLCSANSINIGRLIPQSFYYFHAWSRLPQTQGLSFCVPSGNFGNLSAGVMAWKMGLPVKHFIAACNENDTVPRFLLGGEYEPKASVSTISSAMDVGSPSNFQRLLYFFEGNPAALRAMMSGKRVSDAQTLEAVKRVRSQFNYEIDPHTAVAIQAMDEYRTAGHGEPVVVLSTAHAAKFWEQGEGGPELPPELARIMLLPERIYKAGPQLSEIKSLITTSLY